MTSSRRRSIRRAYGRMVNLTVAQMRRLQRQGPAPFRGANCRPPLEPRALERLTAVLRKRAAELTDADHQLMEKALERIRELRAERPEGNVERSTWRHRLMQLGHDPLQHVQSD